MRNKTVWPQECMKSDLIDECYPVIMVRTEGNYVCKKVVPGFLNKLIFFQSIAMSLRKFTNAVWTIFRLIGLNFMSAWPSVSPPLSSAQSFLILSEICIIYDFSLVMKGDWLTLYRVMARWCNTPTQFEFLIHCNDISYPSIVIICDERRVFKAFLFCSVCCIYQVRNEFGVVDEILDVEEEEVRHCNWVRFIQSANSIDDVNIVGIKVGGRPLFQVSHIQNSNSIKNKMKAWLNRNTPYIKTDHILFYFGRLR